MALSPPKQALLLTPTSLLGIQLPPVAMSASSNRKPRSQRRCRERPSHPSRQRMRSPGNRNGHGWPLPHKQFQSQ